MIIHADECRDCLSGNGLALLACQQVKITTLCTLEGVDVDTAEVAVVNSSLGTESVLAGAAGAAVVIIVLAISLVTVEVTTFVGSVSTGSKQLQSHRSTL